MSFPFIAEGGTHRKLRPALVVQADRYNHSRRAVIIAAITSSRTHARLPCKVAVDRESVEGRLAGLRLDSLIDCQTLATIPNTEIVRRLGTFSTTLMARVDGALKDALGMP